MSEYKFDQWQDLYARRTLLTKSSAIRDLLSVTGRSDVISFAGGLPSTKLTKLKDVIEATRRAIENEGESALQYGPSEGHEGLKECVVALMKDEGVEVRADDILITDGAQQGLDLLGKVFINKGDPIIVEAPSYVGAIQAFTSYEPDFVPIAMDNSGLKIDEVRKSLKKGLKPKFLYTVPNFHNPAGVTMSARRRKELLALAEKHKLLVIEDNAYGLLRFEGQRIPSLRTTDPGVVYLGTFSKAFSPGLRLGWVTAPRPILEKLTTAKQAANLCSSSFSQRVLEEYFGSNDWKKQVKKLSEIYKARRDAMLGALKEFFPKEATWTEPKGGFFVWVTLPEYMDTTELLAEAIREAKVAYVPGRAFYPDGAGKSSMRLAFCFPEPDAIREGVERLAEVVKKQMALYESVTKKLRL
ncbi:MAG: PLP-dependent aminotransferase family protein [Terriglobia bacterium]